MVKKILEKVNSLFKTFIQALKKLFFY